MNGYKPAGHARTNAGIGAASQAADFLLNAIESSKYRSYLIPNFIAALMTKVEGKLNEAVIDYFYFKCGTGYRTYARAILALPLKERIAFAPVLFSDYCVALNESHAELHAIYRLIDLRNTLIHVKPYWYPAELREDSIDYANPAALDPYTKDAGLYSFPVAVLREYDSAVQSFVMSFSRLESRIRKRRFQMEPWFKEVKRRRFQSKGKKGKRAKSQ